MKRIALNFTGINQFSFQHTHCLKKREIKLYLWSNDILFNRCVDFNPKDYKKIYTVFRFRCGPGTVFDESSSVCTWPHLVNPPCTNEYLPTTIYVISKGQIALTTPTYPTYNPTTYPAYPTYPITYPAYPAYPTYPTVVPTTQIYTNANNIKWQGTTHKPPLRWADNTGLCRAPGFKRNEKDCTQFYRYIIQFGFPTTKLKWENKCLSH